MTICIPITAKTFEDVKTKIAQAAPLADMLEFRIDYWDPSIEIEKAMALTKLPIILTLRSEKHGGKFNGSPQEYQKRVKELAKLNAALIDIEFGNPIPSEIPKSQLILSFHEFDKPIDDLHSLVSNMRTIPAKYYKIAMTCNSTLDALRLLNAHHGKDTISIGMGQEGQITRILQPIYCSGITFAVVHAEEAIAPGQLPAYELESIYHFKSLNPETKVFGLIGNPVERSVGNVIHNRGFRKYGINAVYVKMNLNPEELTEFFNYAKQLKFSGLSVTMPLKEATLPYMNEVSSDVRGMKSLNTIVFENDNTKAYNFDGVGALTALEKYLPVNNKHFIIIGAGATGKAISYEALKRGANVKILSRSLDNLSDVQKGYDILVNATPSPMPIPVCHILPNSVVMDVAIRPRFTELLHQATLKNCTCIYGYQMWVNQASGQWKVWFPLKNIEGLSDFLYSEYESLLE